MRARLCLVVCLLAAGLVSCHRDRKKVIGVVPKAISHLFFMSVHAGARDAERDFGVEVLWNGPEEETEYSRQIQIVDSMVARHVDALAISATDQTALVAPVKRAMAAGIPVTIFDSGLAVDNYVTFVATDNHGAGETAARKLGGLLRGKGKVAMLMHKPGGKSTVDREIGFDEVMAKEYPGIHVVARLFGMADRAKSRTAAENILTAHPDLDGMFASAEANSLGAIQALKARGLAGKIRLVTFDFSDAHVAALQDGTIDAMIVQDPYRMGYEAVRTLVDKLNGKTPPKRIDLKARVILKGDLDKPDVKALLFPAWRKQ
ncbi:MAG: substrate-binding domain-containing protein [Bryobacteraceae bacterium]